MLKEGKICTRPFICAKQALLRLSLNIIKFIALAAALPPVALARDSPKFKLSSCTPRRREIEYSLMEINTVIEACRSKYFSFSKLFISLLMRTERAILTWPSRDSIETQLSVGMNYIYPKNVFQLCRHRRNVFLFLANADVAYNIYFHRFCNEKKKN